MLWFFIRNLFLVLSLFEKAEQSAWNVSNSIIYYSNYCEVKYRQLIFEEDQHVLDYSLVLDC